MNLLASYSWLKEYIKTHASAADFARELSLKSMSVESISDLREKYQNIVVGVIESIEPHPNANKLRLAKTSIGSKVVTIVCGGSNIAVSQKVAVALVGSKVRWHGEGDLMTLEPAVIRGVESEGMICAANEIGFEALPQVDGEIWDLTEVTNAKAGTPLIEALDLDDVIFDVEITTNRPDAMGMIGLAREGAASIDAEFTPPSLTAIPEPKTRLPLTISVKDTRHCSRYMAIALTGVKVKPSPFWLQKRLMMAGKKPINNIVDITNYVLLEYAQPMHAFDYDAIAGNEIVVRQAENGERLIVLDGTDCELANNHLIIADKERPLAIAGIMGGKESGVTEQTQTIVFETATFDAVSIRKTARDVNVHSDSKLLFEKGLSMMSPEQALQRAVELTLEIAGGEVATDVLDYQAHSYRPLVFPFAPERVQRVLGVTIEESKQISILERLGFGVEKNEHQYNVTIPFWRDHDIESGVDFTEEIARMYGYHHMPSTIPASPIPVTSRDTSLEVEDTLRLMLAGFGYTELYGYSFVDAKDLALYGIAESEALAILNPLSSDLSHMRPSLMPSLLRTIAQNQGERREEKVFELARVYLPQKGDLPKEESRLVVAEYGKASAEHAYRSLKGVMQSIADESGLALRFDRELDEKHWHKTRSSAIYLENEHVATLGEISKEDAESFGLKVSVFALSINLTVLTPHLKSRRRYTPIPVFPPVTRDVAFVLSERTTFDEVVACLFEECSILSEIALKEVYRGKGIEQGKKSLTLSLTFRSDEKTLSGEEIEEVMKQLLKRLEKTLHAQIR